MYFKLIKSPDSGESTIAYILENGGYEIVAAELLMKSFVNEFIEEVDIQSRPLYIIKMKAQWNVPHLRNAVIEQLQKCIKMAGQNNTYK